MKTIAFLVMISTFLVSESFCPDAKADSSRKLTSFEQGYFYTVTTKEEGVIELSSCGSMTASARPSFKDFACVREGKGFRCTKNDSLDVIFLFDDLKDCDADRTETLNSEEE